MDLPGDTTVNLRDDILDVVPKLTHGAVVDVGQTTTLDTLQQKQATVLTALLVQIRLEVIIDNLAVPFGEAALVPVVAVAEIVALAAWQEVVAKRLVGRVGAAVGAPDQIGGGFVRPGWRRS